MFFAEMNPANGNIIFAKSFQQSTSIIGSESNTGFIDVNGNFWVVGFSGIGNLLTSTTLNLQICNYLLLCSI
jgi:hypothetical protein